MKEFEFKIWPTILIIIGVLIKSSILTAAYFVQKEKEEAAAEGIEVFTIFDTLLCNPLWFIIFGAILITIGLLMMRKEKSNSTDNNKRPEI